MEVIMQNRKRLFIIGAGDEGRELESWLSLIPKDQVDWEVQGFLDDNANALSGFPSEYKILGKIDEYPVQKEDFLVLAISNPKTKKQVYERLVGRANFFSLIYPNVIIGKYTEIGHGAIIFPGAIISNNVIIGDFVTIGCGTQVGHDCIIGSYSSIMANADLGGKCELDEFVFMGTNSTCLPYKRIVSDVTIGSGTIVLRNINKPGTYFGNPAKQI